MAENYGYIPNPVKTAQIVSQWRYPRLMTSFPELLVFEERDVFLWKPLITVEPTWRRGKQLIGDCVSWGGELVCTMLMAMQHVKGEGTWVAEGATESLYGLRAELGDRSWSDGWYGSGCAEALQKYGICLRLDYSKETGNDEHDLREYSGEKAKQWGYYGCGGENDKGKLDAIAKQHPAKGVTQVRNAKEAAAALNIGCPITIASNVGFGSMRRNNDGIVRRSGSWNHQMMIGGVKYFNGEPLFRIFQSWGPNSCSGPDPGIEDEAISGCSWWATAEDIDDILGQEDSYAFSRIEGFIAEAWDWEQNYFV